MYDCNCTIISFVHHTLLEVRTIQQIIIIITAGFHLIICWNKLPHLFPHHMFHKYHSRLSVKKNITVAIGTNGSSNLLGMVILKVSSGASIE